MPKLESYKRVHTEELYFPNDQKIMERATRSFSFTGKV